MLANALLLVAVGVAAFVVAAMLAPLESLGWWAGWFSSDPEAKTSRPARRFNLSTKEPGEPKTHYVVFLDGIARTGYDENLQVVDVFVDRLQAAQPEAEVINELFPYSVDGVALTEQGFLSRFWSFADASKQSFRYSPIGFLINVRNLFQVMVSADPRYGPVFNQAEAQLILNSLFQHGYQRGSKVPVTLIGYSGGAQLAVGATPYLRRALGVPIVVVSIGGVMGADRDVLEVAHLYHLEGSKDGVNRLGGLLFPLRWRIIPFSPWRRAERMGKITFIKTGPMVHTHEGSYMDHESFLDDGTSYCDYTVGVVADIVRKHTPAPEAALS